jgi:PAS domain-containing protein
MRDQGKTKERLIAELQRLRSQIAELRGSGAIYRQIEQEPSEPTFDDLIDIHRLQTLLELHVKITRISVGIRDRELNRLVSAGLQNICMLFHREHPVLNKHCRQSDDIISSHVNDGQYIEYRCKNGLWDVAVPILIAGKHMATLFLGQFFYEDDPSNVQFFQQQGREFGLPEEEYLAALRQVPIFSRDTVQDVINYYTSFVNLLSIMGYSNLSLSHDIKKRQEAEEALRENDERYKALFERSLDVVYLHDFDGNFLDVNKSALDLLGYSREDIPSLNFASLLDPEQLPIALESILELQRWLPE